MESLLGRKKELASKSGRLVVITGTSGSGKDSVVDEILQAEEITSRGYRKVVTHATREIREGEIEGYSYYFINQSTIFEMHERGELVEPPTPTGDSFKATSKRELLKVVEEGQNLIWRIDLSRAAEVASGEFFDKMFESDLAEVLKSNTLVVLVDVKREELENRRRTRDGKKYDPKQYALRDTQETAILDQHGHHFKVKVTNFDGKLEDTIKTVKYHILNF